MYVKYKGYQGKLLSYEYIENTDKVITQIQIDANAILRVICKAEELKVPNIMGNNKILEESK